LIVNPQATSTTRLRRDVIIRALASAVDLEVVQTRYGGHATKLAEQAVPCGFGLVLILGGDGTVNEAVNGLMAGARAGQATVTAGGAGAAGAAAASGTGGLPEEPAGSPPGSEPGRAGLPALAALPGGNANVFVRALGLPADPVDATGQVLEALAAARYHSISLGLAGERFFTVNSGLGFDAEVVRAVEGRRAHGRPVTPALYLRMALRQYYRITDRRHPAVTLEMSGLPPEGPLFLGFISNTSPWTYLGRRPVATNPQASFDAGLDVFGLRSLSTVTALRTLRQMLAQRSEPPRARSVLARHDVPDLVLRADRPVAFQVDGEYMGEREQVRFRCLPHALRVLI
jgi:diacylglycerol kinase family enzyme